MCMCVCTCIHLQVILALDDSKLSKQTSTHAIICKQKAVCQNMGFLILYGVIYEHTFNSYLEYSSYFYTPPIVTHQLLWCLLSLLFKSTSDYQLFFSIWVPHEIMANIRSLLTAIHSSGPGIFAQMKSINTISFIAKLQSHLNRISPNF